MSFDNCRLEVEGILKRKLSNTEVRDVNKTLNDFIKRQEQAGLGDELSVNLEKHIQEMANDIKAQAIIKQRNAALNVKSKIKEGKYLKEVWKDNPVEGLKAVLGDSMTARRGSKNGLSHQVESLKNEYVTGILGRLTEKNLEKVVGSGKFDGEIWKAIHELSNDKPELSGFRPEIIDAAKIIHEYNELARNNANGAGAWIKKLPGYVMKQSHDMMKLQSAAGDLVKSSDPSHQKAWVEHVDKEIDWERSMPDIPVEERATVLGNIYQQLSNGVHVQFGESSAKNMEMSFGKKMSHDRVIHFKTPEAEFEYFKKYGRGDTIIENMIHGLNGMARDTAIMRRLGPNAKDNLNEVVDDLVEGYIRNDQGGLAAATRQEYEKLSRTLWPAITGEMNIPANHVFAKWSLILRQTQMLGQLGGTVISSLTDIAYYGSTMRYVGDRTTGNFFSGMGEAVQNVVGNIGNKPTGDQLQMLSEMGILVHSVQNAMLQVGEMDASSSGGLSKWVQTLFKYNLQSFWSDGIRKGSVFATSNRHASFMQTPYAQLPEGMQSMFNQFDISPVEWDAIRSTTAKVDPDGKKFLTPQHVDEIKDEVIDQLPQVKERIDQIKTKEAKLLENHELTASKNAEKLVVHTDKLKKAKLKAVEDLDFFEKNQTDKTETTVEYYNHRKNLIEARIERAEVEADIASYLHTEKAEGKLNEFLDDLDKSAKRGGVNRGKKEARAADVEKKLDEGKGSRKDVNTHIKNEKNPIPEMSTDKLEKTKSKTKDTVEKYGESRGRIGEELGERRGKADLRVSELESKVKDSKTTATKNIEGKTLKTIEKMETMDNDFKGMVERLAERTEVQAAKVREYQNNVGKFIDAARKNAKTRLRDNYRSLFHFTAKLTTTEPGFVEKAMLLQGTKPGTPMGEAARHFAMYKSFIASTMRNHLGRELYGYGAEKLPIHKALFNMMKDPKGSGFGGMANLMVWGTLFGYGAMTIKDLAKGRTPRVPTDAASFGKIFAASAAQSGAFGIYGDFLFGEMKSRFGHSYVETLLGPTAGNLADTAELFRSIRDGDDAGAKSLSFILNNTPGVNSAKNLFYTKWAMDYLLIYRMQELMNPGYLMRMEQKLQKEKQQEYLVPPSNVIPYGGGF